MFLKNDLTVFNAFKEYCSKNLNHEVVFNLDILYKWVWDFGFNRPSPTYNKSKLKLIIKSLINSEIYMYRKYNLNKTKQVNTDILVPYMFERFDYLDFIFPPLYDLIKQGYKVTIVTTKPIYLRYLKENMDRNINVIYFNDYTNIFDYIRVKINIIKLVKDFSKIKRSLDLNLYEFIKLKEYFVRFYFEKYSFQKILNSTKPKLMYGIHYELNRGILKAFLEYKQNNKSENITIQHGVFDSEYGFTEGFGSDLYILWGKYFEEVRERADMYNIMKSPPSKTIGNPKIQQLLKNHRLKISQGKCKILFVSTPKRPNDLNYKSIELFAKMIKKYDLEQNYEIIYKLHPAEDLTDYNKLLENNFINKIQLVKDGNVFDLLEENSIVIGTVSSVLIEVISIGIPVIQLLPELCKKIDFDWVKDGIIATSNIDELHILVNKIVTDNKYRNLILENESKLIKLMFGNITNTSEEIASLLENKLRYLNV